MSAPRPITNLPTLLRSLRPVVNPGVYVFTCPLPTALIDPALVIASIREPEGLSLILREDHALRLGISSTFRCAWITLTVPSALDAVGLTAAISSALSAAGIPANVVAGMHHDHLFVPLSDEDRALEVLHRLSTEPASSR